MCPFHVKFYLIIGLTAFGILPIARAANSSTTADSSTIVTTESSVISAALETTELSTTTTLAETTLAEVSSTAPADTTTLATTTASSAPADTTTSATTTASAAPADTTTSATTIASSTSADTTTSATTISSALPICNELSVMENIDILGISGTWYEMARKGYGTYIQNLQCLQMDISYMNGTAIVFQTYATELTALNNKSRYEYIVNYNTSNISDYTITYTSYGYLPVPVYKILDTDYVNYLVVCSYVSVWQNSAAAFVYFRDQNTAEEDIYAAVNQAATKYADFDNMNLVYQGPRCSSVSHELPLSALVVLLLATFALKLFN